jgi:hypothetical protein
LRINGLTSRDLFTLSTLPWFASVAIAGSERKHDSVTITAYGVGVGDMHSDNVDVTPHEQIKAWMGYGSKGMDIAGRPRAVCMI